MFNNPLSFTDPSGYQSKSSQRSSPCGSDGGQSFAGRASCSGGFATGEAEAEFPNGRLVINKSDFLEDCGDGYLQCELNNIQMEKKLDAFQTYLDEISRGNVELLINHVTNEGDRFIMVHGGHSMSFDSQGNLGAFVPNVDGATDEFFRNTVVSIALGLSGSIRGAGRSSPRSGDNTKTQSQGSGERKTTGLETKGVRPGPGERTIQGQIDAATAAGNPTVRRGNQELFRVRSNGHGSMEASTTPLNVRHVTPDGRVFYGKGPDTAVTPLHIRELYKSQTGHGTSTLRTRSGGE